MAAGIVPEELILQNPAFQPEMTHFTPPGGIHVHIAGIDVVRVDADTFYVLEDNARTPSGVSYMLENRETMMRLIPELFGSSAWRPWTTTRCAAADPAPVAAHRVEGPTVR